jgi:hypothetical protein
MDALKSFFDFNDVLKTQKFLSSYYLLLAPLGFRSYSLTREHLKDLFLSYTNHMKSISDFTFSSNMSIEEYEKWSSTLLEGPQVDGIRFAPFGSPKHEDIVAKDIPKNILHCSDGLTHSMIDRIVNNIQHISIIDPAQHFNSSAVSRLYILLKEAVKTIVAKVPSSILQTLLPLLKDFSSLREIRLGVLLKLFQRIMMAGSQTFFLVLKSISHLLPIYWNLVTKIITTPIKIPFVYDWFTKRLTK